MGSYLSINTLNVNGLQSPTKRQWLNGYNNKTPICAVYKRPTSNLGTHTDLKCGAGQIFHMNGNQETAVVPILISYKIDFEIKIVIRDKEGLYIMIKGSIQEGDITIVTIYSPNIEAPQNMRQMVTSVKGKINSKKIIVGDFNSPITPMGISTKQKINKE